MSGLKKTENIRSDWRQGGGGGGSGGGGRGGAVEGEVEDDNKGVLHGQVQQ